MAQQVRQHDERAGRLPRGGERAALRESAADRLVQLGVEGATVAQQRLSDGAVYAHAHQCPPAVGPCVMGAALEQWGCLTCLE